MSLLLSRATLRIVNYSFALEMQKGVILITTGGNIFFIKSFPITNRHIGEEKPSYAPRETGS
jgi:hypothetical protein